MSNVMKNCRIILIVNWTTCRSVYMKSYKHVRRIFVYIRTLRARAFPPLRWSLVLLLGLSGLSDLQRSDEVLTYTVRIHFLTSMKTFYI